MQHSHTHEVMFNPSRYFSSPQQVLDDDSLNDQDKKEILHRWAYDVVELEVAEEENMAGIDNNLAKLLQEIHKALYKLGEESDEHGGGSTKHG